MYWFFYSHTSLYNWNILSKALVLKTIKSTPRKCWYSCNISILKNTRNTNNSFRLKGVQLFFWFSRNSSIPICSQIPGSMLMGPLDVNMAFWPYSSCPLLLLVTLSTSTSNHGTRSLPGVQTPRKVLRTEYRTNLYCHLVHWFFCHTVLTSCELYHGWGEIKIIIIIINLMFCVQIHADAARPVWRGPTPPGPTCLLPGTNLMTKFAKRCISL